MPTIEIEAQTKYGVFRDSINFPEGYAYTTQEVERIKQDRINSFVEFLDRASQEPPPDIPPPLEPIMDTPSDLQGQVNG